MLYNNAVYILGLYLLFSHAFLFVEALPSLLQARVQSAPVMSLNNDEPGGPLQRPSQAGEPEIPYLVNTTSRSNDSNPACWPVSLGDKQKPIDKTFESCLPGYNNAGYDPACWAKLQMSEWIPVWVSLQRPCASNHTCGPQNINAWTNRFLHETGGRNDNRDCSTLVNPDYGGCGHPAYESPEDCSKSDALLDARHSYLDWAIYSTSFQLQHSDHTDRSQELAYTSMNGKMSPRKASLTQHPKLMTLSKLLTQCKSVGTG